MRKAALVAWNATLTAACVSQSSHFYSLKILIDSLKSTSKPFLIFYINIAISTSKILIVILILKGTLLNFIQADSFDQRFSLDSTLFIESES